MSTDRQAAPLPSDTTATSALPEYAEMQPGPYGGDAQEEIHYTALDDANVPDSPAHTKRMSSSSRFSTASSADFHRRLMSVASQDKPPRPSVMIGVSPVVLSNMNPVRSGWLHKRGNINKQWKLRWCMLKGGNLYYFKTPQDEVQRGQFSLSRLAIKKTPTENRPWAFQLVPIQSKGRHWVLAAPTEKDMRGWIKALRTEVLGYSDAVDVEDEQALSGDSDDDDDDDAGGDSDGGADDDGMYMEPTVRRDSSDDDNDDASSSDEEYDYDRPYDDTICSAEADTVKRHIATEAKLPPKPMEPRLRHMPPASHTHAHAPDVTSTTSSDGKDSGEGSTDATGDAQQAPPPLPVRRSFIEQGIGIIPADTNLHTCSWYFEGTTRVQAEALLHTPGTFLIRRKSPDAEPALSLRTYDRCLHYKIYFVHERGFTFGSADDKFFSSIVDLVRFYQRNPLPAIEIMLGMPIEV